MSYEVRLEVFEGPFDLLLQLITRRKLDVTEVGLAEITADFLAHLTGLEEMDLETATRFLVVAATLVELKAARLLPAEERDELDDLLGEARDLLYARLLEYRAFRGAARVLEHRLLRHQGYQAREVPPESWILRLVPDTPLPVDAAGLAALAAAATSPTPLDRVDLSHIRKSYITIREAALAVLDALPRAGTKEEFARLVDGRGRGDRVVFFLALLELFKLGHVALEQPDYRGPMLVARRENGHDLDSLTDDEIADEIDAGEDPPAGEGAAAGEDPLTDNDPRPANDGDADAATARPREEPAWTP